MIKQRIEKLRKLMKKNNIDAYIIPGTDPHMSEYLPDLWKRREFISGFNGSAGDVVVTLNKAGLWTDSRYFLQAEMQLAGTGIELFKMGEKGVPHLFEWVVTVLDKDEKVGIDSKLITIEQKQSVLKLFKQKGVELLEMEENLVDLIWSDRPNFPLSEVEVMDEKYAGESVESKLKKVREKIKNKGAKALVISTLDSIAWLFNIRGKDIDYNPMVISYAIVTEKNAKLFLKFEKVTDRLKQHLKSVELFEYNDVKTHLQQIEDKVLVDRALVTSFLVNNLKNSKEIIFDKNPVDMLKAIKNPVEIQGFKECHVRDGVAMVKFFTWLYKSIGKENITEISASEKLLGFRKEQKGFVGASFSTIAGYKEHGAIIHYSATKESDVLLQKEGIFLIDSGGQYIDGTTDITRTITLGSPTSEQKKMFTLVLKGHIDLAMTSFPHGTAGKQLDTIARKPLWDNGFNYGHGTGHGVGHYLSVHEGPHAISYYRCTGVPILEGMVSSNEPGFYKEGEYGIRIENLIVTVKDEEKSKNGIDFYKFENLTLCPIDKNLIDINFLTREELDYLNNYHKLVFDKLSPYVEGDELEWLKEATSPVA
jgi:Xaa-Pro aminopeptidase